MTRRDDAYPDRVRTPPAIEALADMVEAGGLIEHRSGGVILVSGGPDSACAAAACVALCGPEAIAAVHLNYGLRPDSSEDERAARALCAKLRIDLHVERPDLGSGNVQARARDARYSVAEKLRSRLGYGWVATGHTRSDVAETFLYRLAVSPGTRALLGLPPRSGSVVRPLHAISREETRAIATDAELPFHDDPTNASDRYARNRIRNEVLPRLAAIGPEVERNIAATRAELNEEAELLAELVAERLAAAGVDEGATALAAGQLADMSPGLRRLALRELASRAAGKPVSVNRAQAAQITRIAGRPEGGEIELGGGLSAICESGVVRLGTGSEPLPSIVRMSVPGTARFGDWQLSAELREGPLDPTACGPGLAALDAASLGDEVEIRAWRAGDRIRPIGLGGTKTLQDLFTDSGVPRSVRPRIPVVTANGRVAWVAGLAVSEEFKLLEATTEVAVITARAADRGSRAR